jgi:hypothetical protein
MGDLHANFRAINVTDDDFTLTWNMPSGAEYTYRLDSWVIRHYEGEGYTDHVIDKDVFEADAADLSIDPDPQTEYNFILRAKMDYVIGSGHWYRETNLLTLTTLATPDPATVSVNGTWPNYTEWAQGNISILSEMPDGYESWVFMSSYTLYHKEGNGAWEQIAYFDKNQAVDAGPNIITHLTGLDPSIQHHFKGTISFWGIYNWESDVLSINLPITTSNSFNHLPYVYAIPASLSTPTNIFIGNVPPGTAWNPYQGLPLPNDLTEWRQVGTALYSGSLHKVYRLHKDDKAYRKWNDQPATLWDSIQYNILQAPGKYLPQQDNQWWRTTPAATARIYAAANNFVPNGQNHPFVPITAIMPFDPAWDWPSTAVNFTPVETLADTGEETPTMAAAGYLDDSYRDRPVFCASNLNDETFEITSSIIEDYVVKLQGTLLETVTYKLYVFIPHQDVVTDSFKLVEADGTVHSLSQEAADITFNEQTGRLFSKTFTANPMVDPATYNTVMNITPQEYSIEDADAFSFGSFAWPEAPLVVAPLDNGSPFYVGANATVVAKAPASSYTDGVSQIMIVPFEATSTYPSPVIE